MFLTCFSIYFEGKYPPEQCLLTQGSVYSHKARPPYEALVQETEILKGRGTLNKRFQTLHLLSATLPSCQVPAEPSLLPNSVKVLRGPLTSSGYNLVIFAGRRRPGEGGQGHFFFFSNHQLCVRVPMEKNQVIICLPSQTPACSIVPSIKHCQLMSLFGY